MEVMFWALPEYLRLGLLMHYQEIWGCYHGDDFGVFSRQDPSSDKEVSQYTGVICSYLLLVIGPSRAWG